jgi:hypothetical protein
MAGNLRVMTLVMAPITEVHYFCKMANSGNSDKLETYLSRQFDLS